MLGRSISGRVVTAEHRAVINQICDDAKASGISIEQIIISLKALFDKVPHTGGNAHTRAEIRERVIAVCIEEYYRDGRATPSQSGRDDSSCEIVRSQDGGAPPRRT